VSRCWLLKGGDGYELGTHCMNLQKKVGNNFCTAFSVEHLFFIFYFLLLLESNLIYSRFNYFMFRVFIFVCDILLNSIVFSVCISIFKVVHDSYEMIVGFG
jgi:hypothetical protein